MGPAVTPPAPFPRLGLLDQDRGVALSDTESYRALSDPQVIWRVATGPHPGSEKAPNGPLGLWRQGEAEEGR